MEALFQVLSVCDPSNFIRHVSPLLAGSRLVACLVLRALCSVKPSTIRSTVALGGKVPQKL